MASNSYYHNGYTQPQRQPSYSTTTSAYHDHDNSRNDAPLPPLPYNSSHSPSPSPFVDPYGQPSSDPSRYDTDPYDDQHAIPLNDNARKHGSMHSVAPILPPQHPDDDPFVRDAKPGKKRRRTGDGRGVEEDEGWFKGKITWCCFLFSVVQLIVFLVEIIKYGMLTGTPIQLKPSFNPMIGPSPYLYINMGARYQPCMHNMDGVQNAKQLPVNWPCPNTTSTDPADTQCTLSQLCGFGGVPDIHFDLADGEKLPNSPAPNQWWRFIVPIFLHGGIIHIAFNLLLQLTLGRDVEKLIGSIRFFIVYMAAGIFGFVLGGNFAATGIASTGASGSLFGILAITLLDLLYNWSTRPSPGKELLFIAIDIVIAFVLGLLPGLDNFSHIGGFLMGLVLGVCILRSPTAISRRTESSSSNYNRTKYSSTKESLQTFVKQPVAFSRDRRSVWWVWWAVRAAAALGALIGFILLLKNFYVWRTGCGWCKHLSCLPIKTGGSDWCSIGNLQFSNSTSKA